MKMQMQRQQMEQRQLQQQTLLPPMTMPSMLTQAYLGAVPGMIPPGVVPGMMPPGGMYYDPYNPAAYVDPNAVFNSEVLEEGLDEEDIVVDEKGNKRKNALPMHGNTSNYNINTLLFDNIMSNDYFRALYQLRTYHEVIGEIERTVKHVEPWQTGTARFPSSAFCLLVKFCLMKLTEKQMNGLLKYTENAFVRAIGFLYLRYVAPPADLWQWFAPYLEDVQEIQPASDKNLHMTIGAFCIKLLTEMQYFGTTLPRIPVPIERKFKVLLLLLDERKARRQQNLRQLDRFPVGSKVQAIYSDAENEPAWYEAVIDSIEYDEHASDHKSARHKIFVTFPEYGNSECVDLGDLRLPPSSSTTSSSSATGNGTNRRETSGHDDERRDTSDRRSGENRRGDSRRRDDSRDRRNNSSNNGSDRHRRRDDSRDRSRSRDRDHHRSQHRRSRSRSRDRHGSRTDGNGDSAVTADALLQRVIASERAASAAVGRNYAQRPTSYKGSLSMKLDSFVVHSHGSAGNSNSNQDRDRDRERDRERDRDRDRRRSPARVSDRFGGRGGGEGGWGGAPDRMKMLKERYGDASALSK